MKKKLLTLLAGLACLSSCYKDDFAPPPAPEPCIGQTQNPEGRTYTTDSVTTYTCEQRHCGLMPLSLKGFWIYEDSLFEDGVFNRVQRDTLRFTETVRTSPDNLTWWKSDYFVGLPQTLFTNDSAIFSLTERFFMPGFQDVKKEYCLFSGDSARYLTSFDDMAAMGRSLKCSAPVTTPAGSFSGCLYFEKNARFYRKDQVYFKAGIGVVKFIQEEVPMGGRELKMKRISTLVRYERG